jgi:hypothetical protein
LADFLQRGLHIIGRSGIVIVVVAIGLLASADDAPAGAVSHTVNSTGDQVDANVGDTVCDVDLVASGLQCTIRAAFAELSGGTSVFFDLPGCPATPANCVISPNGVLPPLAT